MTYHPAVYVWCFLSSQKQFYKQLLARHYPVLAGAAKRGGGQSVTQLKNLVMQLRKCCNHPYLFEGADPGVCVCVRVCICVCVRVCVLFLCYQVHASVCCAPRLSTRKQADSLLCVCVSLNDMACSRVCVCVRVRACVCVQACPKTLIRQSNN